MKYLIINADDYGSTPGVSRGIREAHLNGIVTSTTAMMNMPGVEDVLREAIETCPNLGLGVHLVLTAGAPILPASKVASVINHEEQYFKLAEFVKRIPSLDLKQVRAEWQAQIENFCDVVGRAPDHLDSHHHTSYMSEALFSTMLDLAEEYHCAIRSPREASEANDSDDGADVDPAVMAMRASVRASANLLARRAVPHPDYFITSFYDEGATLENLLSILSDLRDGVSEIMSHPGYADEEIMSKSSYNLQRERELQVLTDARVKAALQDLRIELINFAKLAS